MRSLIFSIYEREIILRYQAAKVISKAIALTVFLVAFIVFLNNSAGQISGIFDAEGGFCISFSSNKAVLYDEFGKEKTTIDIYSPGFTGIKEVNEYIVIYDARASKLLNYSYSGEFVSSSPANSSVQVYLRPQCDELLLSNGVKIKYSYVLGYEKVELIKDDIPHKVFSGFSPSFPFYAAIALIWFLIFVGFIKDIIKKH